MVILLGDISSNLSFKDVPFYNENWSSKKNDSGLREEIKNIINKIQPPSNNINYDITYRISYPFNFNNKFNSKAIFIFATTEYKNLARADYTNNDPIKLSKEKNFFIHKKII